MHARRERCTRIICVCYPFLIHFSPARVFFVPGHLCAITCAASWYLAGYFGSPRMLSIHIFFRWMAIVLISSASNVRSFRESMNQTCSAIIDKNTFYWYTELSFRSGQVWGSTPKQRVAASICDGTPFFLFIIIPVLILSWGWPYTVSKSLFHFFPVKFDRNGSNVRWNAS